MILETPVGQEKEEGSSTVLFAQLAALLVVVAALLGAFWRPSRRLKGWRTWRRWQELTGLRWRSMRWMGTFTGRALLREKLRKQTGSR